MSPRLDAQHHLVALVDDGLGNSSYLLDLGDGRALAVDPPRDLRALRAATAEHGLTIAYAADTHLHADFLSGAGQLAVTDGAAILASAAGRRTFDHRGLADGDEVDLGGLTLRAMATPGHTDEHLAFLLLDGQTPVGVFTGGSLLVGAAARTDLLGADRTVELAHAQYASLQRLAQLPDASAVWPTHGAGSFCAVPPGPDRTSTIEREKATNPLLAAPDEVAFGKALQDSLGSYPRYFSWLTELNRNGPPVLHGEPALPSLAAAEVRRLVAAGATIVDLRPVVDFAAAHMPGAIAIPLRDQFATWLGWLVDPHAPIVIVRNPDQNPADILWPALNIGYERIAGELTGGMPAWVAAGGQATTTATVRPSEVDRPVLDIRQRGEYAGGHLPGASHVELGSVAEQADALLHEPYVVMCGHGERAVTAASLLERAGHHDIAVLLGGPSDWARTSGRALEVGE